MNEVQQLILSMVHAGKRPSPEKLERRITGVIHYGSGSEREGVRRGIKVMVNQALAILEQNGADRDDELLSLVEDAGIKFGPYTNTVETDRETQRLVEKIRKRREESSDERDQRVDGLREGKKTREGLEDALARASRSGGVDPVELDGFQLRDDLSDADKEAWRGKVRKAARRVSEIARTGAGQSARMVAKEAAAELGGALAPIVRRDEAAHIPDDDGRALADAVHARRRGVA